MKVSIKKWGNSASVRIPAAIMQAAHVKLDQVVDMREEDGRIIIEPAPQPEYDLHDLLSGITEENRHKEVDFGATVGNEVW